jgi:hypothetical protein
MPDVDGRAPLAWGDEHAVAALTAAAACGQPSQSIALYVRWWQLETWLRDLIYVELRARDGVNWADSAKAALGRQNQDAEFTHMASTDGPNPLAYLDYSQLLAIIGDQWDLFGYALINRPSWDGRQDDLKRIRHRIGHMRRPHSDDLNRLEQTLRDLERGTFLALSAYNDPYYLEGDSFDDPVTRGWVAGEHPTAQLQLAHAARQYDTVLEVTYTKRDWAKPLDESGPNGRPGYFWHVNISIGASRRFNMDGFWRGLLETPAAPYLVHALVDDPWDVTYTFATVDDGDEIANSIASILSGTLTHSRRTDTIMSGSEQDAWMSRLIGRDYRLLVSSAWTTVTPDMIPINIFGASGGVVANPRR